MKDVENLFDQYGGIPRICVQFLHKPNLLADHRKGSENAIQNFAIRTLYDHISNLTQLSFGDVPHAIFVVKRTDLDDLHAMTVEPVASSVRERLKTQIQTLRHAEQIGLYNNLAHEQSSRQIAGLVFESLAQSMLQRRFVLRLIPMQKQGSRKKTYWVSAHEDQSYSGADWELENGEVCSLVTLNFQPSHTVEYEGNSIDNIDEGVFYIPKTTNQVAFDSFIISDGFLYIVRFSIASKYDTTAPVSFFSGQLPLPPKANWRFIFVIPSGNSISFPQPSDSKLAEFLKGVRLFSAQLNIQEDLVWNDEDNRTAKDGKVKAEYKRKKSGVPRRHLLRRDKQGHSRDKSEGNLRRSQRIRKGNNPL
ncbi:hypothetical protein BC826DRAFT_387922 [Russula brevipes]|nr:hypothetical protein BC826DRAFT_387922 [Russula brevipes]